MQRRAAVITGTGAVRVETDEMPALAEQEIAIQVQASLISPGTEMSGVRRLREHPEPDTPPRRFGYACAGKIVEVRGDARGLSVGQRVAAMGTNALHADRVHVPVNLVTALPDSVDAEDAVYACLGATALQAVYRAEPKLGDFGLVLGLGIVGNLAAQLARCSGARVMGWDGLRGRRSIARASGVEAVADPGKETVTQAAAEWAAPFGMDFSIFAFGGDGTPAFRRVLGVMKRSPDTHQMGHIVLVGGCSVEVGGGAASGNVDVRVSSRTGPGYHDPAWERGADYPNALLARTTQRNLREIIRLIDEHRLVVAPMTTHTLPLSAAGRAADLLLDAPNEALGIVLKPD